jgi:hypothetical protein
MDKDRLAELLGEALEEVEGDASGLDRLSAAVEQLARAIESRPYLYYQERFGGTPISWAEIDNRVSLSTKEATA